MTSPRLQRSVAAAIAGALAIGLSGCANLGLSQNAWASALEELPGVVSVDWTYRDGWPNSGKTYDSDIVLAPDLTAEQAHAISDESCAHDTVITRIALTTPGPDGGQRTGVSDSSASESACLPEAAILAFAQTNAARQAATEFDGRFEILGLSNSDESSADPATTDSLRVTARATEEAMLVDALRELHAHITDSPLRFSGEVSGSAAPLSRSPTPVEALLSPDADFTRLEALVVQALTVNHEKIIVTDERVEVQVTSSDVLGSAELGEFHRLADELGIQQLTRFPPLGSAEPRDDGAADKAFIKALSAVPGGARVAVPAGDAAGDITVDVNDIAGFEAAVQLVAAAPEYTRTFQITAPGPRLFWVSMTSGGIDPQRVTEVLTAALGASEDITGADRTIVELSSASSSLTVVLAKTSDAGAEREARTVLTALVGTGLFAEIDLDGPNIDFRDRRIE